MAKSTKNNSSKIAENESKPFDFVLNIRIAILFILHLVGLIGYCLEEYRMLFQWITPIHLILITFVLFWDNDAFTPSFWIFFSLAFLIGYGAEVFGVESGLLFGYYSYTDYLGPKLLKVPLVIGLLWAGVGYACNQVAFRLLPQSKPVAIVTAALLMVMFDYMIEPFAIHAELWVWHLSVIPAFNYLSWFIVGLLISIIYGYTIKSHNNLASPYFLISQLIFFILYQLIHNNFTVSPFD